jgi:RNA polymerase sigma-70 factor, ECF subfamily
LGSFRLDSPLRPWLRRIATNVCVDSLRRRQAETMPLEEVLGSAAEPRSRSTDELPEEAALTRESREYVREQIRALPPDYRAALVLRYLEDLSYREIAEALGVSVSAVETRLFRARRALSRVLSPPPADGRAAGRSGLEEREDRNPGREGSSHDVQVDRSGIL